MMAAVVETGWQRLVPLQGVSNFRDLGGYAGAGGRAVKRGRLYRSAALAGLTDHDWARLAELGLRTVCDFRAEHECQTAPTRVPHGGVPAIVPLPIRSSGGASLRDLFASAAATPGGVRNALMQAYREYPLTHAERYRALFATLTEADSYPLVFHCTAGKDRTGFAAALVLTALGVSADDVLADYLLTNTHWQGRELLPYDLPDDVRAALIAADADYLAAGFAAVAAAHGSVEAYLERALGVDDAARARLHDLLLA